MTCNQWNAAVAEVQKLPKSEQKAKMDALYKKLEAEARNK